MSKIVDADVKTILTVLRETPADTKAASDDILGAIYQYLINVPSSSNGDIHWFCKRANATTADAATFLIRLMAYNSAQVTDWKKRLHHCLSSCPHCVHGLELAKVTSQDTFLAAFTKPTLEAFFVEFNKWELQEVLKELDSVGRVIPSSMTQTTLSTDLLIGTFYRLVSNWTIFGDTRVLSYLQACVPPNHVNDWPDFPIPPGVLVLLLIDNSALRTWAEARASSSKIIPAHLFLGSYNEAMELVIHVMKASGEKISGSESTPTTIRHIVDYLGFSQSSELWPGLLAVLRLTPPEWLKSSVGQPVKLRRIVLDHLRDRNSHFTDVLRCFIFLLKRLGQDMWSGDELDGPQTALASIKDNSFYLTLIQSPPATSSNLAWIPEYLLTVRGHSAYEDILEKLVDFLCEDAQQEMFQEVRPSLITFSTRMLHKELQRFRASNDSAHISVILKVLETHFPTMAYLAYGKKYTEQIWKSAREFAHKLVDDVLSESIRSINDAVSHLCRILGQMKVRIKPDPPPIFSFGNRNWKTLYSTIQTPDAISCIICIVSKAAHLDNLKPAVFSNQWDSPEGDRLLTEVNEAIDALQNGFSTSISSFSEYSISSNALGILQRNGVGRAVTLLLLSPIQDFHEAGKTLVGLAFDVDNRMECFRAMLEKFPIEALDGILEFLSTFREYASGIPEACTLSATLVRCLADILEVLCASSDGLLHDPSFLRRQDGTEPASRIPTFWKLLTKALAVIYNRASMWATHIDTPDMVLWMRDALILARDVVKQWKVIENASNQCKNTSSAHPTGKLSPVGILMIDDLQKFLPELIKWLRLTDEELLHQSFSLLQSLFDLMKEAHIRPSDIAMEKLKKYVEAARNTDETAREQKTRLDRGRVLQLSEVLAYFEGREMDSEDEVVIVSSTRPSKQVPEAPRPKSGAELRSYIQGKAQGKAPQAKVITRPQPSTSKLTSTKPSGSKFFTETDQRALDLATSIPSFRKSGLVTPAVELSKADPRRPLTRAEPKNEALGQLIPVSEDSDSSSSESDEDGEPGPGTDAFQKSPKPKSPRKPKQVERRQIKYLPTCNNPMQDRLRNRQTHYNALRLRPDISSLHRIILSWDYNHSGSVPPGNSIHPTHIHDRFDNYDHYFRVFQPLLLMECWSQLQQSKEETQESYQCKVDSRQYVDEWLDIDVSISESVRKEWYLAETDIVLLRHAGHEKCLMAKVKSYKAAQSGIQATMRCYVQSGIGDPGLQMTTRWQVSKVLSLSTLHREYAALVSLQYNDICNFILRPSLPKGAEVDAKELREAMEVYKVNEPQAMAILKAMKTQGFTLIQGPPGTGKTSTICGLIAHFLSRRLRVPIPILVGNTGLSGTSSRNISEPASPTRRILVCAPSNAAIDELAQRIKDGHIGSQKTSNSMNIVRIGAEQAMNASVRDISLDYLVERKLDTGPKPLGDIGNEIRAIRQEIESIKDIRRVKIEELTASHDNQSRTATLENDVKTLNSRRQTLITKLDHKRDQQKSDSRTLDTLRRNTRREILSQADVVCSTLSGAGHETLENLEFDMIIIDEAAQAIELSSLIPLKYGCSRCIMVGDPQQLPPTVLSPEASRFGYNQSLFVRLQRSRKDAVHLLSIQYRMHPDISCLPSQIFYDSKLIDGPSMMDKTQQPWHADARFGTYKFLNISAVEEKVGHSIKNSAECIVAVDLYNRLRRDFSSIDFDFRVGVVSMYKAQIKALRSLFAARLGNDILTKIDFNTVDGFQGQEKDIIILSCVRAGPGLQNVGFLSDTRRMNVALTRAKSSLFILGNAPTLERSDDTWRQIIRDARSRSVLVNTDTNFFASSIPVPAEPMSKKKPRLTAALPLPPLSTPQEFNAVKQDIPAAASSSIPQAIIPDIATNLPPQNDHMRGTKRSADTDQARDVRSSKSEPFRKRSKQQSMFIPKKRT